MQTMHQKFISRIGVLLLAGADYEKLHGSVRIDVANLLEII